MLKSEDFLAWFQRLRLPECARAIINQIRSSGPARHVGGGRQNVSGRYPSKKMGVVIQFESHRVELARIYELEHDPEVLEYWDQPPSFRLEYKSAQGKQVVAVGQHKIDGRCLGFTALGSSLACNVQNGRSAMRGWLYGIDSSNSSARQSRAKVARSHQGTHGNGDSSGLRNAQAEKHLRIVERAAERVQQPRIARPRRFDVFDGPHGALATTT